MKTSFSISHFKVVGRSSIEIPSSTNATWKNTFYILDSKHIKFVGKKTKFKTISLCTIAKEERETIFIRMLNQRQLVFKPYQMLKHPLMSSCKILILYNY